MAGYNQNNPLHIYFISQQTLFQTPLQIAGNKSGGEMFFFVFWSILNMLEIANLIPTIYTFL